VQGPHHGDRHDPPGLSRALAILTAALVAAPAAGAAAPRFAPLLSPLAPLSTSPPLSGGAAASAEGIRHRVSATTSVRVSLDGAGKPFAVSATQTLDVGGKGDYFFTIGAPALDVEAASGSQSTPGLRSTSILWAGFDPGHRKLAATIVLDARSAVPGLPLRIEATAGHITLANTTSTTAGGFTAEVETAPLLRYLAQLRANVEAGRVPTAGGASVTSASHAETFHTWATLRVSGTVGGQRIDRLLGAAPETIAAHGAISLTVEPVPPLALLRSPPGLSGRALLRRVTLALLGIARARQYDAYLGNPDPTGRNRTTYVYRSAKRPLPVVAAAPAPVPGNGGRTLLLVAALLAAATVGVAAWARS
jgi:hypothetical protein